VKGFMIVMGLIFGLCFVLSGFAWLTALGSAAVYLNSALVSLAGTAFFFFLAYVCDYMNSKKAMSVMIYRQLLENTAALNDQEAINSEVQTFRSDFALVSKYLA